MNYIQKMINELNELADKIYEHIEAGGEILTDSDHDKAMATIERASDYADWDEEELLIALHRAKSALQAWNNEEYPYLEDIMGSMFPDGIDDGYDFYDED